MSGRNRHFLLHVLESGLLISGALMLVAFVSIRGWFYGGLLIVNVIDLADSFLKGFEWGARPGYVAYWLAVTGAAVLALNTSRRWVHMTLGITLLIYNVIFTFYDTPILGRW